MNHQDLSPVAALLPADLPDHSRAWIFQSSRPFIEKEEVEINEQLHQFYIQWKAHGIPVKGWARLLFRQFIVVLADEQHTQVSGCSTDGMVRIIKSLERQYEVSFFDRMMLTFLINGKAEMLPLGQLQYALDNGHIHPDTQVFNNIVSDKKELMHRWLVPFSQSWAAPRVSFSQG